MLSLTISESVVEGLMMSGSVTTSSRVTVSEASAASSRGRQSFRIAHGVAFGAEAPGVSGEVHLPYLDAGRAAERLFLVHRYGAM